MIQVHRARWVFDSPKADQLRCFEKGALAFDKQGQILAVGSFSDVKKRIPKAKIVDHGANSVITPGFVDCHVHAPQLEMMAAAGYSLLDWLNNYTFPTEAKYSNVNYASKKYKEFCHGLIASGTTTAAIYATSHTAATLKLMQIAHSAGLRAFVGKVLMDRNAPGNLVQNAEEAIGELEEIIKNWKKTERVKPSITVRFAPTSTPQLLKGAGELSRKYPELVVQTHLAETKAEISWVKELFPNAKNYTDVYDSCGLVHQRTLLAHCIYLEDSEISLVQKRGASAVHCPSSNFFLGSGLFPYQKLKRAGVNVNLGSDVGGGWDLSISSTARCCYEAQALQGVFLKPSELLYLATVAGAKSLGLNNIGLFEPGYRADFVVSDLDKNPLTMARSKNLKSKDEVLSLLLFLNGGNLVSKTFIDGKKVY